MNADPRSLVSNGKGPSIASDPVAGPPCLARELTSREVEVLALVTEGMTNREIASELGIKERTARQHVAQILLKFGVASRVEAAVIATKWQLGIVP
ncbi:response regulator transcription factor [Streptomyces sp. NPDC087300]|uniref:response regulator transcription factor n=1 Tax=Streptomyces sp. NPDC087300 TaxID=3365780 RepID=UPI003821B5DF